MNPQVIEVSATSPHSFEEAIRRAVQRAACQVGAISSSRITKQERIAREGDAVEFRVHLQLM